MASPNLIVVFNAGSSSIKLGVFEAEGDEVKNVGRAVIDLSARPLVFQMKEGPESFDAEMTGQLSDDLHDVIDEAFWILSRNFDINSVKAVGHRVVHGGERFVKAVRIDADVIEAINALTPMAPFHQPPALRLIRAVSHLRPELPQSASFDTAFHVTQSDIVRRFAIPRTLHDGGVKRYGFHGLSYKFVSREVSKLVWPGRTIIAHLGSGASLCALHDGESRDCSMGFSALDGIPMATRSGALDPGVVLHLITEKKMSNDDIKDMLYHRSGLLGVSGKNADIRKLLADESREAGEAIDLMCLRIAGEIGRMCSTIDGLDTLVFTAGIGEHQPNIRAKIASRLSWLGVEIEDHSNASNAELISSPHSRVKTFVIPTNEEQIVAEEALSVLS